MSEAASAPPSRTRLLPWLVLGITLSILAGAILISTLHLRRAMRLQIVQQDGIILYASSFIQPSLLDDLGPEVAADVELSFSVLAERMFETASKGGALALRLFDSSGQLQMATPVPAQPRRLNAEELAAMRKFQPMSSFDSAAEMRDFGVESLDGPVVRALIPLKSEGKLVGAAEFVLDGQKVAAALAGLDRDLWRSSLMVFIAAGVIITLSLGWAYSRLNRTNLLLSHRTQSLLRANHELMLAAKTSAIGAITAHLIHDLKNPLFGLQSFVRTRGSVDDQDWDIAADAAERMQKMIAEVVRILQEEKTTELYDLSIAEVFTVIQNKLKPEADKAGVELLITESFEETMLNRNANIVSLVLTNLAHNAIQATPRGGRVTLSAARTSEGATFEVADTGPGFSESMMKSLFTPCRSTKSGGTGLGLAISKHLANHLGAELRLKKTSSQGSTFELSVPESTFVSAPALS